MKKALFIFLVLTISLLAGAESQVKIADEWQLILLGSRRIGTSHRLTFEVEEGCYRTELFQSMIVQRVSREFTVSQKDVWIEDDAFISLQSEINMNGEIQRLYAEAVPGGIKINLERKSRKSEEFINSSRRVLGFYLASQELKEAVAEGKKEINYTIFSPETMKLEEVRVEILSSGKMEDSSGRQYRGIIAKERFSGFSGLVTSLVLNDRGEVIYSRSPVGLPLEVVTVKPIRGKEGENGRNVSPGREHPDLPLFEMTSMGIPVQGMNLLPGTVDRLCSATFRFKGTGLGSLEDALDSALSDLGGRGIDIQRAGDILEVTILAPEKIPFQELGLLKRVPGENEFVDDYLKDGFHLNLDDPRLKRLLAGCNRAQTVRCMQNIVYEFIVNKSLRYGFASADEILESQEGDCTEHSLLLVSLLRKKAVPARIAYGFILTEQGFSGHAWTELNAEGRWYWLDPSFPAWEAQRLKIRMGVLDPARPVWNQMNLSILKVAGGVKAEIVEWNFEQESGAYY